MKNRIKSIDEFISESFFSNVNVGEEAKTRAWLDQMGIKKYTINKDGTVDVKGNVDITDKGLEEIPIKFGRVSGNFWCHRNKLTSLEGVPKEVGGEFWCNDNKLTTLEGVPEEVGGTFSCSRNKLTTLEGAPEIVSDNFHCQSNKLTSLKGAPKKVKGSFFCYNNKVKFSKEDVRAVIKVKGEIIV